MSARDYNATQDERRAGFFNVWIGRAWRLDRDVQELVARIGVHEQQRVRHWAAQVKLYVPSTEPRVQSSAATAPLQGRIFLLATLSHGEAMPLSRRLGFAARRRIRALHHLASNAGNHQSRTTQQDVDTEIERAMLAAGRVPVM